MKNLFAIPILRPEIRWWAFSNAHENARAGLLSMRSLTERNQKEFANQTRSRELLLLLILRRPSYALRCAALFFVHFQRRLMLGFASMHRNEFR